MNRTLRKDPLWFRRLDLIANKSVLLGVLFLTIYLGIVIVLTWTN